MIENRRAHEVTFIEAVAGCAFAAANQSGSIFAANIDVTQNRLELVLIDAWSHLCLRISSRADTHRLRPFGEALHKLIRHVVHDDRAARGRAAVSGRAKRAPWRGG